MKVTVESTIFVNIRTKTYLEFLAIHKCFRTDVDWDMRSAKNIWNLALKTLVSWERHFLSWALILFKEYVIEINYLYCSYFFLKIVPNELEKQWIIQNSNLNWKSSLKYLFSKYAVSHYTACLFLIICKVT